MPPKPKPPAPPITIQQIAGTLSSVVSGISELLAQTPALSEEARHTINSFITNPAIAKILGPNAQHPSPAPLPPALLNDIKAIKSSLSALQKVMPANIQGGKTPTTPKPPTSSPQEPTSKPSGNVVISLANTDWSGSRPTPAQICEGINSALEHAQNDQARVSAARWTARDNLVLTGSPNTSAQSLKLATPTIRQHFSESFPASHVILPPLSVRPNVKWSKILINSVPTGVSPSASAYSPDECHAALVENNPTYSSLNVTQRPSWVRNPSSYANDAVSSLVVAFEDPDGSLARGLLASKMLFIFGNCATVRKWKQRPSPRKPRTGTTFTAQTHNSPAQPPHESVPTSPTGFSFGFIPPDPDPDPAPTPRQSQDMEGEKDNAGRTRTATRSSNRNP
ncbi:hypothetical protein EDB84DRAFT_1571292 [Lactarius hengduanensis]|nr:hypothetical protein EDB84DRAFT_1571292 [Lactarius hengduanensis]